MNTAAILQKTITPVTLTEQLILLRQRISVLINHINVMNDSDVGVALNDLAGQFCEISIPFVPETLEEKNANLAALAMTMAAIQEHPAISDADLAAAAAVIRYERRLIDTIYTD